MTIACDAEWTLMYISVCALILSNKDKEPIKNYKKMTLSPMIDHTVSTLSTYNKLLYKEYESLFEELKLCNEERRKFAHCTIKGDDNKIDKTFLTVIDITETGKLIPVKYLFIKISDELNKFQKILIRLGWLADTLSREVYNRFGYYIKESQE